MKYTTLTVAALSAILLPLAAAAQEEKQLVDVVATGYGETVREAQKAAFRAAVEQVVGTIVDATTLVENDELIEDEILTYASGMIEKSITIGEPRKSESGIYIVKVKATVKKGRLQEKLKAASTVSVSLNGADLFARMTAAQENLADAETMIRNVLAKHIACVVYDFVKEKDGNPKLDIDPKSGEVFVSVRARVDMAKYTQFINEVIEKLGPMAEKKAKVISKGCYNSPSRGEYVANGFVSYEIPGLEDDRDGPTSDFLLAMTSFRTGTATVLWFDKNRINTIRSCLDTGSMAFAVTLFDATGTEIAERQIPIDGRHKDEGYTSPPSIFFHNCAIVPFFGGKMIRYSGVGTSNSSMDHASKTENVFKVSLGTFTPDELKSVGPLKIQSGHMKNGQFTE